MVIEKNMKAGLEIFPEYHLQSVKAEVRESV
jgi:hypothetical protein